MCIKNTVLQFNIIMYQSVLVTGGNSEIGQKIVLELLKNGYYVIFTWYSNLKKLENLEESISCYEDKYRHYKCDLRKRNEIDSLFTFIESLKYPHLVGIVNNVGISGNKCKLSDMNIQEINEIFEVNVFSLMAVIKKGINSADLVISALPYTADTHHFFNSSLLNKM